MNSEAQLAWVLTETTAKQFTRYDRAWVYAELGAGETYVAIWHILAIVVSERHSLPTHLVTALTTWLDGYIGNEHEPAIRNLLNNANRHTHNLSTNSRRIDERLRGAVTGNNRTRSPRQRRAPEPAKTLARRDARGVNGGLVSPSRRPSPKHADDTSWPDDRETVDPRIG
jgi:hypothetical protein